MPVHAPHPDGHVGVFASETEKVGLAGRPRTPLAHPHSSLTRTPRSRLL